MVYKYIHIMVLLLILIIVSLTSSFVISTPQCTPNLANTNTNICINVEYLNDLRGLVQRDWQQLTIVNKEVKQLEWNDIPEELENLEILDLSQVGELILKDNGFSNFPSLRVLNVSSCKIESLSDTYFNDLNKLERLDASWNALKDLRFRLKNKFKLLEVANFSHNDIQSMDAEGIMPQLRVLHLDFNELRRISLQNYTNLNILTLSENLIDELKTNSFIMLKSMQDLKLTSNPLKYIEEKTFESMTELKKLNISSNSLEQLSPEVFVGLNHVLQLDVNSNNLRELAPLQFQHLLKLQYLDISRNSLKSLNSSHFNNLVNLRKLYIYENDIEEIKANTFANLISLDTLDLSYNGIEQFGEDVFGSNTLPQLRKLMLKSNNLKILHPLAFASLPFLLYLSLGLNQLTSLDVRMFAPMRRLEKVHLGNNQIQTIPAEVLESLTDVSELLLDNNRLSYLSDSKAVFAKLEKVSLEGNPWQCPCWDEMANFLESRNISYVRQQSPYFKGQKPLCVVTPVKFCVKDLRLVRQHKIEEIYNSG